MAPDLPIVVFSDVDSVLDEACVHSWTHAANIFKGLDRDHVPVVLCSRRTRAEIEAIQQKLGTNHPFVCESGGAAFIPSGYFGFPVPSAHDHAGYEAVEFGRPYAEVVESLRRTAKRMGITVVGFHEMSVDDVARECGLPLLNARLAKLREYGERFRVLGPGETARGRLFKGLTAARLRCIADEPFDHVGAPVDNRVGVSLLRALYQRVRGAVLTVGLADHVSDDDLLQLVDRRIIMSDGHGAKGGADLVGWAEAIVDIVEELRRQERPRHMTL